MRHAARPRSVVLLVFVVVEHAGRVLIVRERKHGQKWYAPAGGVEPGESIAEAAIRETREEAGIAIEPLGILRVDQAWQPAETGLAAWWRFVLRARPDGSLVPKSVADEHSLEARWVEPRELSRFELRHPEVIEIVDLALAAGSRLAAMIASMREIVRNRDEHGSPRDDVGRDSITSDPDGVAGTFP